MYQPPQPASSEESVETTLLSAPEADAPPSYAQPAAQYPLSTPVDFPSQQSLPALVDFPTHASTFAPGSNFYIYLCCGALTPWFMLGRIGHKLGLPYAGSLSLSALAVSVLVYILYFVGSDPEVRVSGEGRAGLLVVATLLSLVLALLTGLLRCAFRGAHTLPGSYLADVAQSTPWVCCLPCYAPPASRPMQCSYAYQLALMESAQVAAAAAAAASTSGATKGSNLSGSLSAASVQSPSPSGEGRWSSDLCGCTCNQRCEGDVPVCLCASAYGWWMQARLLQRLGRTGASSSFWKWAAGLCVLEALPDFWDFVATLTAAQGPLVLVLSLLARVPVFCVNFALRRQVRERYRIAEAFACEDALVSCCCYPCSIAQQDREMSLRGEAEEGGAAQAGL